MKVCPVAASTLSILKAGGYSAPSGTWRELAAISARARVGTRLYNPTQLGDLLARSVAEQGTASQSTTSAFCEVTPETTGAAARRLAASGPVVLLNFASARNPGGGFLGGARAQEEDLARCSALYECLLAQPEYYRANREFESPLYTDHLLYSPEVPFFRDDDHELLEEPYLASVITSPAPNAGAWLGAHDDRSELSRTLARRAAMVLAVARAHGHRRLVLGAWGCGVFGNDPREVAAVFAELLRGPRFAGAFDHVTFAIWDRSPKRGTLAAFRAALSP